MEKAPGGEGEGLGQSEKDGQDPRTVLLQKAGWVVTSREEGKAESAQTGAHCCFLEA